jgi:hypothetical protein
MKKILLVTFAVMMLASVSFAAWNPTPLEITVQDEVIYAFDGTEVDIPVEVEGKAAKAYLWINTRLAEADKPVDLTNGYLGWHTVNGIDTTVYISGAKDLPVGTAGKFTWNGIGSENTSGEYQGTIEPSDAVAAGVYDYFVFAYDDKNARENVCNFLAISYYWHPQYLRVGEWHDDGTPRTNPLLWGNIAAMFNDLHAQKDGDGNITGPIKDPDSNQDWNSYGPPIFTAFKFELGNDPDAQDQMETTFMPGFSKAEGEELCPAPIVFDPTDESVFYCVHDKTTQKNGAMFKWNWVSGGDATVVDDWGGWDDLPIKTESNRGFDEYDTGATTDGEYLYIASPGRVADVKWDKFYVVSFDGEEVSNQMLDEFYRPDSKNKNGYVNRMFAAIDVPGQAVLGGEQHCMMMCVNTSRIADGDDSYLKFINENGDFFLDAGWDPEVTDPAELWECNQGGFKTPNMGRRDEQWFDSNGVVVHHPDFQGLMSIVVYTQDGSGVAYCKFADDTVSMTDASGAKKGSGQRCDNGSIYDGMYVGFTLFEGGGYGANRQNINWIAQDSAAGIISDGPVAVAEAGQAAFSVAAAYPNPANPTTTIGFTLAEAGHVAVDIYNVAGQKVDTLVNSDMSVGSHSVVWNASQFSAGVYFYTVKSGSFSKTMKVTLLK